MIKDVTLVKVYHSISCNDLMCAIKEMENYLALHPHQINSDRLYAIRADYQMMIDYWRKGYKDPQINELYIKLLQRMYMLLANVVIKTRSLQSPLLASLFIKANLSPRDWSVQVVREQLETFVSDIALLELEPPHTIAERRKQLFQQHYQLLNEVFAHILTSDLWTDGQGEATEQMLLSPTIDSNDQQLLVSAITLAARNCFDMVKFRTLIHVYQQSSDEYVRQRALVGWVYSIDAQLASPIYPEMKSLVEQTLQNPNSVKELVELQKQVYYCLGAEEDRHTIEQEILPELIKNQQNIARTGIMEQDEESVLNDIMHPDAEEQNLEKLEGSFRRMIDMQKQGSDVYFGGFSQMKRFPFFNEIANWFTPFYMDHPAIAQARERFGNVKFLMSILKYGPFCNSDKYSFILAFETVLNQIPENVRGMLDRGEAMMVQKVAQEEMTSPAYIRRIYLQDLFRFFRLHPVRNEFDSIFREDTSKAALFLKDSLFDHPALAVHFKEIASFLIKRKRKNDAAFLLSLLHDEQYYDYDYFMLMAYLSDEPKQYYLNALKLNPDSERALQGLAKVWFNELHYENALEAYDRLLALKPDKKAYLLNKAVCLTNLYCYDEAEQILFRLNYEDASDLNVVRVLAWALTGDGKYDQAQRLFEQLMAEEKPAERDRINYAFCLWFSGKVDEAANCFRTSVMNTEPQGKRWAGLYNIILDEMELLLSKGFTHDDMRMMIDWIDVYGL